MKKIIAILTALIMSVSVMASSFKANALVLEASVIAELVSICSSFLIGSGAYTQSQVNDMSSTDILNNTKSVGLSFDWGANAKQKAEFITNFNSFINNSIKKQGEDISGFISDGGLSELVTSKLADFIHSNKDLLNTYENPALNGAACSLVCYSKRSDGSLYISKIYYGTKGEFYRFQDTDFTVCIKYFSTVAYDEDGSIIATSDCDNSISFQHYYATSNNKFYGTWYNRADGSINTELISGASEIPEAIGTVNVDGEDLAVNGDGTVIKDGVTYVINDDGSVTIGDTTYYPDYDLSVYPTTTIINLIGDISDNIDVVEDATDDVYDDTFENIGDKTAVGVETLDNLMLPKTIITVFPFSLPWDFVRGMKLFAAEPETPHFEVNIKVPAFLNVPEQKWNLVIDLKQFEPVAKISRWCSMIEFSLLLIFLTSKIVKGGV